jgi:hypothetical protein
MLCKQIARVTGRLALALARRLESLINLGNAFGLRPAGLVMRLPADIYLHYRDRLAGLSTRQKLLSAGLNLAGLAVLVWLIRPPQVTVASKRRLQPGRKKVH